jgi:hypothetical protein
LPLKEKNWRWFAVNRLAYVRRTNRAAAASAGVVVCDVIVSRVSPYPVLTM